MTDLPRLRAGGMGGQFWSVYVPGDLPADEAVTRRSSRSTSRAGDRALPDMPRAAHPADDVERAPRDGRVGSLLGIEGGQAIGNSLGRAARVLATWGPAT